MSEACNLSCSLHWYEAAWGWAAIRDAWEARYYLDDHGRWRWRVWHRGCLLAEGATRWPERSREAAERVAELSEGDRRRMIYRRSKLKAKVNQGCT